jgi:hypothetical protein
MVTISRTDGLQLQRPHTFSRPASQRERVFVHIDPGAYQKWHAVVSAPGGVYCATPASFSKKLVEHKLGLRDSSRHGEAWLN